MNKHIVSKFRYILSFSLAVGLIAIGIASYGISRPNIDNASKTDRQTDNYISSFSVSTIGKNQDLSQDSTKEDYGSIQSSSRLNIPILTYHHIGNLDGINSKDKIGIGLRVSPTIFDEQLSKLAAKNYHTITVDQLFDHVQGRLKLPTNPIMITLDDGFKDAFENALPVLVKHNYVANFAIITSVLGTSEYMTWSDVKNLQQAKMGIMSHTVNHCYLAADNPDKAERSLKPTLNSPIQEGLNQLCPRFADYQQLNTGQVQGELRQSKYDLEQKLGIKIDAIVYPYGKYNQQTLHIAQSEGYKLGFTTRSEIEYKIDLGHPLEIGRISVQGQQDGTLKGFFN